MEENNHLAKAGIFYLWSHLQVDKNNNLKLGKIEKVIINIPS